MVLVSKVSGSFLFVHLPRYVISGRLYLDWAWQSRGFDPHRSPRYRPRPWTSQSDWWSWKRMFWTFAPGEEPSDTAILTSIFSYFRLTAETLSLTFITHLISSDILLQLSKEKKHSAIFFRNNGFRRTGEWDWCIRHQSRVWRICVSWGTSMRVQSSETCSSGTGRSWFMWVEQWNDGVKRLII